MWWWWPRAFGSDQTKSLQPLEIQGAVVTFMKLVDYVKPPPKSLLLDARQVLVLGMTSPNGLCLPRDKKCFSIRVDVSQCHWITLSACPLRFRAHIEWPRRSKIFFPMPQAWVTFFRADWGEQLKFNQTFKFYRKYTLTEISWKKNIFLASGFVHMTFQLMPSCLVCTFLSWICISPMDHFGPIGSQYFRNLKAATITAIRATGKITQSGVSSPCWWQHCCILICKKIMKLAKTAHLLSRISAAI